MEELLAQQDLDPEGASHAGDAPLSGRDLVLERLLRAHETWFNVQRDYELAGRTFPGFAVFHELGERYVLSRRAKLWEVANHEYILFEVTEHLDEAAFCELVDFAKTEGFKLVDPTEPNHMSSNVSLVIIADSTDEGIGRAVRRTRYRKTYKLGLAGWSDLRVAVIDLSVRPSGRVLTNAAGKSLRATLEANLDPTAKKRKR